MAAEQQASWHDALSPSPPLHALFLVRFDKRKGNTIVWHKTLPAAALELDASLEYKALPSGLHTVEQDLIYFTHDYHAGLSAFENAPASAAERNASFFAVGLLAPLDGSRLGRIWLFAKELQALAVKLRASVLEGSDDAVPGDVRSELEAFWSRYHESDDDTGNGDGPRAPAKPAARGRPRAWTESANPGMSESHPASSIAPLLDAFGPLIFPLHRAALLRRSILLVQRPPLRPVCDYVYLLSVFTNLPSSIADEFPDTSARLDPLFTVGTYDMTELSRRANDARDGGTEAWIACTSDELLATRNDLWDVKVEFPGSTVGYGEDQTWPRISTRSGKAVKATHRDVRRYKALRRRLYKVLNEDVGEDAAQDEEDASLLHNKSQEDDSDAQWVVPDEASVVEPLPWAAIAYDSFLWWASAGERSSELREEDQHDAEMLQAAFTGRPGSPMAMPRPGTSVEVALVTYFQRATAAMLTTLVRVVSEVDSVREEGAKLVVQKADLAAMGLDGWSKDDRECVQELVGVFFGVEAEVQGAAVECCGVRFL